MKIIFSQAILSRVVNHAYIKSKGIKKHTRNRFPILGSSSFLTFTTKYLLFCTLWSLRFSSEWAPSWFYWETFEMEEQSKKTFFFRSFLCLTKLYIFLSFLFCQRCFHSLVNIQNDYLLNTSHMKRENPNRLIGFLWKACWIRSFSWARRET